MSETTMLPPLPGETTAAAKRIPTVYFIDDSATMREVVKIAFRRESMNVVTCGDASSALALFAEQPPDVVITDVIMPDQDGYSVCTHIKQHAEYKDIPVVLMSGVVNKAVADKAVAVQADELIRKPFQPQELIGRVRHLLGPKMATALIISQPANTTALNELFAPAPPPVPAVETPTPGAGAALRKPLSVAEQAYAESVWPRALVEAFAEKLEAAPTVAATASQKTVVSQEAVRPPAKNAELQKLRGEMARLELLVKKLQTELQIERQYNQALELHIQNLLRGE